jgi:hypothetical protein
VTFMCGARAGVLEWQGRDVNEPASGCYVLLRRRTATALVSTTQHPVMQFTVYARAAGPDQINLNLISPICKRDKATGAGRGRLHPAAVAPLLKAEQEPTDPLEHRRMSPPALCSPRDFCRRRIPSYRGCHPPSRCFSQLRLVADLLDGAIKVRSTEAREEHLVRQGGAVDTISRRYLCGLSLHEGSATKRQSAAVRSRRQAVPPVP